MLRNKNINTPDYSRLSSNFHSRAKSSEDLRLSAGLRQRETLMEIMSNSIAAFNVQKYGSKFRLLSESGSVSRHKFAENRHAGHIKLMVMLQNL